MKLSQIIEHLNLGELSLANLGGDEEDGINSNNLSKVVNWINLGLTSLYTKFPIKKKEVFINPVDHITQYKLHTNYLVNNESSNQLHKYLVDTPDDPFLNDVAVIHKVFDELGCEIDINDHHSCDSIFTPSVDVVQIRCPNPNRSINIVYRALPKKLETKGRCILDQDVELPETYLQALLYYVSSKYYGSRGNSESLNESNDYLIKYKMECDAIINNGTMVQNNTEMNSFCRGGWV